MFLCFLKNLTLAPHTHKHPSASIHGDWPFTLGWQWALWVAIGPNISHCIPTLKSYAMCHLSLCICKMYVYIEELYIYTCKRVKRKVKYFLSIVKKEMCVDCRHIRYRVQTVLCPVPQHIGSTRWKCLLIFGGQINWDWNRVGYPFWGL